MEKPSAGDENEGEEKSPEKEMGVAENPSTNKKPKNTKKQRSGILYIIRKFGCMISDDGVPVEEAPGGNRRDHPPTHLIVTVNGILGCAKDWRYAAKQFVKAHPDDVLVHCSEANYSRLTFDGIDVMGSRLADEVVSVIQRYPALKKISFIGHSLGGLIARYAVAVLYRQDGSSIGGLEPVNFITAATPHLGSRGHKQIPLFCGVYSLEKAASHASGLFGRTGKHQFLCDGEPPLLVKMCMDSEDLKFISALQLFKKRIVYANARFDYIVGWSSSSLRRLNELPKRRNLKRSSKYPHIVNEEISDAQAPLETPLPEDPTSAMEEMMIRGLSSMSWHRVDISFKGRIQRIFAHTTIQVQKQRRDAQGTDVIQHMIDNFEL